MGTVLVSVYIVPIKKAMQRVHNFFYSNNCPVDKATNNNAQIPIARDFLVYADHLLVCPSRNY